MRVLLDTHLLLWAKTAPRRLPEALQLFITQPDVEPLFSAASIWEIAIKQSQLRDDFRVDAAEMRAELLDTGYGELPVLGEHAIAVAGLPWIHKDPFDRLLVAQAMVESVDLLTVDRQLGRYPGPIRVF
ncbi:type II toxin-antitoxin system VapC family toxin [Devosia sp.]|uniref:type II toxin-antitoxin system VapC family toxin n=1 Tax=Devosia sp. TaxID=1871048 RepID=UPI003BAC3508